MNSKLCIGILGGGQLAKMTSQQAIRMGIDVAILEKELNSPAGSLTKNEIVGSVNDKECLDKIALLSDVITLENEFIDFKYLENLESKNKRVVPSSKTISLIQDKLIQKNTFKEAGIPVPKFVQIIKNDNFSRLQPLLGFQMILKSRKMGYDGYGNYRVIDENSFNEGVNILSKRGGELYCEELVEFKMELAIMVVRTTKEIKTYPLVQTFQENHICKYVIAPAPVDESIKKSAEAIAKKCVLSVDGFGIYAVEMFLTKENKILVNEMAPRPHNSAHYTIEGCITSQFENHVRSVLDLPLGSTEMIKPVAAMVNLLGKNDSLSILENCNTVFQNKNAHLHIYGKNISRIGRKMGHITLIGEDANKLLEELKLVEQNVNL